MHKIGFIQLFESIKDHREVVPDQSLPISAIEHALLLHLAPVIHQISLIAELKHNIDDIVVADDVLNADDVLVLAQFYEGEDLLTTGGYNVLDCFDLLVGLGYLDYF